MYRVEVLWHRCRGCPHCEEATPLFKVVETSQGPKAVVRGAKAAVVGSEELYEVLKAQNRCPSGGIVIKPLRPWIIEP
ncbi:iron-sulfur protein [Pyrobaculum ferrireducens]|uniref:Iron-sulfur protein, putative n=1 Tax=Pyrobaculum ferrireducens TaxID=1104324 RepID=G7VHJ5_9CREN|nr:iron-sulfur protein [Pyrobaculum ferrireducens]AET33286.1 iron-sulfur protein, putative [Pyrobaculum ferrireducens]